MVEADEVTDDEDDVALFTRSRSLPLVDEDGEEDVDHDAISADTEDLLLQDSMSPRLDHDTLRSSSDTASVTSKSTDNSEDESSAIQPEQLEDIKKEDAPKASGLTVTAKVGGRFISKYVPPSLPVINKKSKASCPVTKK